MIADMSLNATSWRRIRRFTTSLRPSQSSLHAPFLKCGLFACSALNARSNDCHVGLLCMTQRAQYRTQMWVRTLCVVVRTDFLCYPVHFQHKKLNSPWRCSRVPVGADPLSVGRRVSQSASGLATSSLPKTHICTVRRGLAGDEYWSRCGAVCVKDGQKKSKHRTKPCPQHTHVSHRPSVQYSRENAP